jgi:hypothetical protein
MQHLTGPAAAGDGGGVRDKDGARAVLGVRDACEDQAQAQGVDEYAREVVAQVEFESENSDPFIIS